VIILTTEDCRMEDPEAIAAQIKEGIQEHPCTFVEDRFAAIQQALEIANPGDTVLILGKGDETYQDLRDGKQHWMGDNVAARQILRNLYGGTAKGDGK
jgi:UDP-N-acetylmuramyl tripeptide synthase